MATENLYATSHITGTCPTPNNANGAPDGVWTTGANTNVSWTSRWAMGNPSTGIAGTQTIRVHASKGTNSGNPTIDAINLWENGSLVSNLLSSAVSITVSSGSGQDVDVTFDASSISNKDNVEIEIATTGTGGSPSNRNCVVIDAIQWIANLVDPNAQVTPSAVAAVVVFPIVVIPTTIFENFDSLSDNTTLDTSNTFFNVEVSGTATTTAETASGEGISAITGTMIAKIVSTGDTDTKSLVVSQPAPLAPDVWFREYVYIPQGGVATTTRISSLDTGVATPVLGIRIHSGSPATISLDNSMSTVAATSGNIDVSSSGCWVRIEVHRTQSNTYAQMKCWWTDPNSSGTPDYDSGSVNIYSTGAHARLRVALIPEENVSSTLYFDAIAIGNVDWIGPAGEASPDAQVTGLSGVAAVATIPSVGINIKINAASVTSTATIPNIEVVVKPLATAVSAVASVPAARINVTVNAGAVGAQASVPSVGVSTGLTATSVTITTTVPAPGISTKPQPSPIVVIANVMSPYLSTGLTALAVVVLAAVPSVTVITANDASVSATAVNAITIFPTGGTVTHIFTTEDFSGTWWESESSSDYLITGITFTVSETTSSSGGRYLNPPSGTYWDNGEGMTRHMTLWRTDNTATPIAIGSRVQHESDGSGVWVDVNWDGGPVTLSPGYTYMVTQTTPTAANNGYYARFDSSHITNGILVTWESGGYHGWYRYSSGTEAWLEYPPDAWQTDYGVDITVGSTGVDVHTGSTVAPSAVGAILNIPTPSLPVSVNTVASTTTVPIPTVTVATDVSINANAVPTVGTIPVVAGISAGLTVNAVGAIVSIPFAPVKVAPQPSAISAIATIPSVRISAGLTVVSVPAVSTIPSVGINVRLSAVAVTAIANVPIVSGIPNNVKALAVAALSAVSTVRISAGLTVGSVTAIATVPTVGVSAGLTVLAVTAIATIPTVQVVVKAQPVAVTAVASIPTVGISAGLTVVAVTAIANVPTVIVSAGFTAVAVTAVATIPTVQVVVKVQPVAVPTIASIPTVGVSAGLTVGFVAATVTVPTVGISSRHNAVAVVAIASVPVVTGIPNNVKALAVAGIALVPTVTPTSDSQIIAVAVSAIVAIEVAKGVVVLQTAHWNSGNTGAHAPAQTWAGPTFTPAAGNVALLYVEMSSNQSSSPVVNGSDSWTLVAHDSLVRQAVYISDVLNGSTVSTSITTDSAANVAAVLVEVANSSGVGATVVVDVGG